MAPRSSAVIGVLLTLPLAFLISIEWFQIEPFSSYFRSITTEPGSNRINSLGLAITFGSLLLLPVAFLVARVPIASAKKAGGSARAYPANLAVSFVILAAMLWILGAFIVDQYPCWIGVPNCD